MKDEISWQSVTRHFRLSFLRETDGSSVKMPFSAPPTAGFPQVYASSSIMIVNGCRACHPVSSSALGDSLVSSIGLQGS